MPLYSDEVGDDSFRVVGSADATKKLAFEVDGLSVGTRTLTPQASADYIIAGTNIQNSFTERQTFANTNAGNEAVAITPAVDQTALLIQNFSATPAAAMLSLKTSAGGNLGGIAGYGAFSMVDMSGSNTPLTLWNGLGGATGTVALSVNSVASNVTWNFPNSSGTTFVGTTATQTLTNKTLTTPTIASFTNATHNHQNAAGGGQLDLTLAVTGDLPFANLAQGSARSVLGVTGNATADVASIQGTTNQVLRVDGAGTGLAFGSIDLSKSATVGTSDLAFANLAQGSARSVLGVTGNATADVASIQGTANQLLQVNAAGTALAFVSPGSLTGMAFKDNAFSVVDDGDATKTIVFSLGGATTGADLIIASSQTADHTITLPDATTTLAGLSVPQTWSAAQLMDVDLGGTVNYQGLQGNTFLNYEQTIESPPASGIFVPQGIYASISAPAAMTGDTNLELPNNLGNQVILTRDGAQIATNKRIASASGAASYINCGTSSVTSARFANGTSTTQYMLLDLSALTASRNIKIQNEPGTVPLVVVPSGASVDLTGKTAAYASTTIFTTLHAGMYRLSAYVVTTNWTSTGTITPKATWTDDSTTTYTSVAVPSAALTHTAAGQQSQGSMVMQCSSGSVVKIETSFSGTCTYNVYFRLESLT